MKKAIVIGATSGIGRGLSEFLSDKDWKIGITGRRLELLNEIKNHNSDCFVIKQIDVLDLDNIEKNLDLLVEQLGGIDLVFLSSGTGDLNPNLDFEIEKRTIETNVTGFTMIADWAFRKFSEQKYGSFVAISSVAGLRGSGDAPAYNATKAFQINYLEGLRCKAKKLKLPIYVTDIRPGFVDTAMAKGEGLFWVASVPKAVKQIYKAIEKKKKVVYISRRWKMIAVLLKIMPRIFYEKM